MVLRKNSKLIKVDVEVRAVYTRNKRLIELRYEMDIITFNLLFKLKIYSRIMKYGIMVDDH